MKLTRLALTVGFGNELALIGDDNDAMTIPDRLVLQKVGRHEVTRMDLGDLTHKRIDELKEFLERLRPHAL